MYHDLSLRIKRLISTFKIIYVFIGVIKANVGEQVKIVTYDDDGSIIQSSVTDGLNETFSKIAKLEGYHHVGTGSDIIEFWSHNDCHLNGLKVMEISLWIATDFVATSRNPSGEDSVTVMLRCANQDRVDLCRNEGEASLCPTLLLGQANEVMQFSAEDKLAPLHPLFDAWTAESGFNLKDDAVRFYEYSLKMDRDWVAAPLTSDMRILIYNRTTFDALGLMHPPPYGNWSVPLAQSWSWEKAVEVARHIGDATGLPGFTVWGGDDEEWQLSLLLALAAKSPLFAPQGPPNFSQSTECGLGASFQSVVDGTVANLLASGTLGPAEGVVDTASEDFLRWMQAAVLPDPHQHEYLIPGNYLENLTVPGMAVASPSALLRPLAEATGWDYAAMEECFTPVGCRHTELRFGWMPGEWSSLTGRALVVLKSASQRQQQLGFELAHAMLRRASDYGEAVLSPPPLESLWGEKPWNTGFWLTLRQQLEHSVPPHYPLAWSKEIARIKTHTPFRMMWLEMGYKNISAKRAVERVCDIVDDHAVGPFNCSEVDIKDLHRYKQCRPCYYSDYDYKVVPCGIQKGRSKYQRSVHFFLKANVSNCIQLDFQELVHQLDCEFTRFDGLGGGISVVFISIGSFIALAYMLWIFWNRRIPIVKSTQPPLTYIVGGSALTANLSILFTLGRPTPCKCILFFWLSNLCATLLLGSLHAKIRRIQLLFGASNPLGKRKVPVRKVLPFYGFCVAVEVILLLFYTIFEDSKVTFTQAPLMPSDVGYLSCHWSSYIVGMEVSLKAFMLLQASHKAWKVRKVSSVFSEGRELLIASYNLALVSCGVALVLWFFDATWVVVCAVGAFLMTAPSLLVLFVPKLTKRRMTRMQIVNELRRDSMASSQSGCNTNTRRIPEVSNRPVRKPSITIRRKESNETQSFKVSSAKSHPGRKYSITVDTRKRDSIESSNSPLPSPVEQTRLLFQGSDIFHVNDSEISRFLRPGAKWEEEKDKAEMIACSPKILPVIQPLSKEDATSPPKATSPKLDQVRNDLSRIQHLEAVNKSLEDELAALQKQCGNGCLQLPPGGQVAPRLPSTVRGDPRITSPQSSISPLSPQSSMSPFTPTKKKPPSIQFLKKVPPIDLALLKRQASDAMSHSAHSVQSMMSTSANSIQRITTPTCKLFKQSKTSETEKSQAISLLSEDESGFTEAVDPVMDSSRSSQGSSIGFSATEDDTCARVIFTQRFLHENEGWSVEEEEAVKHMREAVMNMRLKHIQRPFQEEDGDTNYQFSEIDTQSPPNTQFEEVFPGRRTVKSHSSRSAFARQTERRLKGLQPQNERLAKSENAIPKAEITLPEYQLRLITGRKDENLDEMPTHFPCRTVLEMNSRDTFS